MSLDGAAAEVSSGFAVRNLGDKIEEGAPKTSSDFCVTKKEHGKQVLSSALRGLGNEIEVCYVTVSEVEMRSEYAHVAVSEVRVGDAGRTVLVR